MLMETRVTRDRRLSEAKQPKRNQRPTADRDEDLDQALRELGDEVLNQEIPERLLRVLRSARGADRTRKADRNNNRNGS
jgi:hypothetical protein